MKISFPHLAQKHSFSSALMLNHHANMQRDVSLDEFDNDLPSFKLEGMRDVNL